VKIVLVSVGLGVWGLVIGDIVLTLVYGAAMLILIPASRGFAFRPGDLIRKQLSFGIPSLASGFMATACSVFRS